MSKILTHLGVPTEAAFFGVVCSSLLGVRGAGVGGVVTCWPIVATVPNEPGLYRLGATIRLGDFNVLLTIGSELALRMR